MEQELRSMQWPYDHPRRGEAPPEYHAIRFNEYNIRKPPYAKGSAFKHVFSYVGGWVDRTTSRNILVDEKNHPYTGTKYAWVRARLLGGKTNIWAVWRCDSPTTTSRERPTTATAKTGRSRMRH